MNGIYNISYQIRVDWYHLSVIQTYSHNIAPLDRHAVLIWRITCLGETRQGVQIGAHVCVLMSLCGYSSDWRNWVRKVFGARSLHNIFELF